MEIDDNVRSALYPIAPKIYKRLSNSLHRALNILSESEHLRKDGQLYSSFNQFFEMFNALENQATPYQLHRPLAKRLHSEIYSFIQNIDAIPASIIGILQDLASQLMIAIEDSRTNELDEQTKEQIRHLLERNRKLLEDTQLSVQNRVDEGSEAIRSTLQSVRDELDTHANRAEIQIKNLVSKAEHQNKLHQADLKESFKAHEEESTNRIQVKIQQAETLISTLNGLVEANQKKNEEYIELNNSAVRAHAKETREDAIGAIDAATSKSLGEVHQAQSNALALFTTEAQTATDKINGRIDEEVKLFEDKKKEITEILGEISTAYQAGANTRQADEEKAVADEYRKNGLRGMYIAIGVTVLMFSEFLGLHVWKSAEEITQISELGPQWFVLRIMTITLLASPAIYMLKESATHRNKENLYRQRGTQLSSIGAYLDELSPASKSELKKELAANFFSFYDGKADTSNVPDFIKNMNDAVKVAKSINGQTKTEPSQK
ncbi:hypothetical protein [Vibrio splendidus]|uniref:hypothetical protein n=1 Tax=Vibrio splendidus TaxID=29497 RepID=UPI000D3CDC3B|nr:hypothetical protein [Vibrio splendidus]PTP95691.1 hypothetical protein CWO02_02240 [Vibrio splendidus]